MLDSLRNVISMVRLFNVGEIIQKVIRPMFICNLLVNQCSLYVNFYANIILTFFCQIDSYVL